MTPDPWVDTTPRDMPHRHTWLAPIRLCATCGAAKEVDVLTQQPEECPNDSSGHVWVEHRTYVGQRSFRSCRRCGETQDDGNGDTR